jgi:hypothetical protein
LIKSEIQLWPSLLQEYFYSIHLADASGVVHVLHSLETWIFIIIVLYKPVEDSSLGLNEAAFQNDLSQVG